MQDSVRKSAGSSQMFARYNAQKENSDLCSWEIRTVLDYPSNRNSAQKYVHIGNRDGVCFLVS